MMLYCIKFPLQQAAPEWPVWAPENTIFSLLKCGAKLVAAGEAGQSRPAFCIWLGTPHTPVQLESSAVPAHAQLPQLPQDGCLQAGWRVSRHTVIPDKWLPALSNHSFT